MEQRREFWEWLRTVQHAEFEYNVGRGRYQMDDYRPTRTASRSVDKGVIRETLAALGEEVTEERVSQVVEYALTHYFSRRARTGTSSGFLRAP
jgi:hypothetical protein